MRGLLAIVRRDLALSLRAGGGAGIGVIFFLAVVMVVPFAVGPEQKLIAQIGPAVLWIGALLASLLGLDRIFGADAEDGSLDLLLLAPQPLEAIAAAKALAHWLATGLPLVIAAPLLGLLLGVEGKVLVTSVLMLLVGTPAIAFLGLIGAALAATLPRAGLLIAVLILHDSGADLRHGCDGGCGRLALRHCVQAALRVDAVFLRHRADCGRGGAPDRTRPMKRLRRIAGEFGHA
jgi:heme exporter protein B